MDYFVKFGPGIKGVIFDIDGVLLDSLTIWKDLGERYLRQKGKQPEEGLSRTFFSMSMEESSQYLKERYLPEYTPGQILTELQDLLRDFYLFEAKARPGVKDYLKSLKEAGIRITAATAGPGELEEKALERNGLLIYIEKIFTNSQPGFDKHTPDIYDAASAYMGLGREEVCVFEDAPYALRTAEQAGYHTVEVK